MLVGLCGKTNVGKTTFFNALTLANAKVAPHPFTTINANEGVGYVKIKCVCKEYGVKCNPKTGFCLNNYRFIPVKILDVAGLVRDAHKGRGLGNKFLDDLRKADVNILVVDASGRTDEEGKPCKKGTYDPIEDVNLVMNEFTFWIRDLLIKNWRKILGKLLKDPTKFEEILLQELSGLGLKRASLKSSLDETGLRNKKPRDWTSQDLMNFARKLLEHGKPFIVAANKIDVENSSVNVEKIMDKGYTVIPTSAEAELALRKASEKGIISYVPGEEKFKLIKQEVPTEIKKALELIDKRVLRKWGSTGVQQCLNKAVFETAHYIAIFPVENEKTLTDHQGNVLPDVYLVPKGTTVKQFAGLIHTDLEKTFLFALLVNENNKRVGADYALKHRDIVKIVSAKGRK